MESSAPGIRCNYFFSRYFSPDKKLRLVGTNVENSQPSRTSQRSFWKLIDLIRNLKQVHINLNFGIGTKHINLYPARHFPRRNIYRSIIPTVLIRQSHYFKNQFLPMHLRGTEWTSIAIFLNGPYIIFITFILWWDIAAWVWNEYLCEFAKQFSSLHDGSVGLVTLLGTHSIPDPGIEVSLSITEHWHNDNEIPKG